MVKVQLYKMSKSRSMTAEEYIKVGFDYFSFDILWKFNDFIHSMSDK